MDPLTVRPDQLIDPSFVLRQQRSLDHHVFTRINLHEPRMRHEEWLVLLDNWLCVNFEDQLKMLAHLHNRTGTC